MPLSSYKPLLPLVIMGSALIISVNVNAQGLQCNNPASAIEKTICASSALTKMNNRLEQAYAQLKKTQSPVDQVVTTNTQSQSHEHIKK